MQKDLGRAITFPRSFCGEFAAVQAAVNSRHLPLENLHSFASRRIHTVAEAMENLRLYKPRGIRDFGRWRICSLRIAENLAEFPSAGELDFKSPKKSRSLSSRYLSSSSRYAFEPGSIVLTLNARKPKIRTYGSRLKCIPG